MLVKNFNNQKGYLLLSLVCSLCLLSLLISAVLSLSLTANQIKKSKKNNINLWELSPIRLSNNLNKNLLCKTESSLNYFALKECSIKTKSTKLKMIDYDQK